MKIKEMKELFRIKIEAFNFNQIVHTFYSDDLETYPSHEQIKEFIEDYKLTFGRIRVECQVIKVYVLDN